MWARFWFSMPAERTPPPPPFTPPPPPPAPPQYGPLPEPSSVASLYALAGDFLDRAKTALVTGGPAGPDAISSTSGARRAVSELTAPASRAAPAATKNDKRTFSSRAVHWIIVGPVVAAVLLVLCVVACVVRRRRRRHRRRPVLPAQLPPPMVYHKDGLTWPVLQQATPSEYYFAQQQRPTPPQTSGTFSDAGTDRHHSVDVVTELPTGGSHSYDQLAAATDGFAPGNIIGQGGFGCVYRGMLNGAEVEIISRVHHRNLVPLVGYCIYSDERLLVYEFVPNKTLDSHLHGELLEVLGPQFCMYACSMNVLDWTLAKLGLCMGAFTWIWWVFDPPI
uniref:non-specific serine/threonine protein kinase n=1 Tax=Setaria italica TaxID=4555 RepID=K4ALL5_SETIT